MWQQFWTIFKNQFYQTGIEGIGYFIVAFCFGLFYAHSTQGYRFRMISKGCYILGVAGLMAMIVPNLKLLNPAFAVPERINMMIHTFFLCLGMSYLWASLFVGDYNKKQLAILLGLLTFIQILCYQALYWFFPVFHVTNWVLALTWLILGFSFIFMRSTGRTSWFHVVGDILVGLSLYYVSKEFDVFTAFGWIWMALFIVLSFFVLVAQIHYMGFNCDELELKLAQEKRRRTMFWDLAPFPILVSKLLDDSVLYMNVMAQEALKITAEDVIYFHLSDYFTDVAKRNELVERVRQEQIVDSFEVAMKSPKTGEIIWLDLSARVVKMDGDLALYLTLHNVTEQKATEEKLFKEASTDALTGLYNRRQFEAMVQQALASSKRYKTPYCIWMSDIDHFKHVNDTYGHEAGDIVLKNIAQILQTNLRESDIIGRFGGEEFIVMLTNTDLAGARVAAENVRKAVESAQIDADGQKIPVTISIGITATQNDDLMQLTKEADMALYYSKEHGRNQVSVYHPEMIVNAEVK